MGYYALSNWHAPVEATSYNFVIKVFVTRPLVATLEALNAKQKPFESCHGEPHVDAPWCVGNGLQMGLAARSVVSEVYGLVDVLAALLGVLDIIPFFWLVQTGAADYWSESSS